MTIWNILWPFGIIYGRLVQFVVICYIFPNLVCFDHVKSGNPEQTHRHVTKALRLYHLSGAQHVLTLGLNVLGICMFEAKDQCGQIGRIFAQWATVNFRHFFRKITRIAKTFSRSFFYGKSDALILTLHELGHMQGCQMV
jgi:hypothetical protein